MNLLNLYSSSTVRHKINLLNGVLSFPSPKPVNAAETESQTCTTILPKPGGEEVMDLYLC